MPRTLKVILMLDNSRACDRRTVHGIVEYAHLRGNWSFYSFDPLFRSRPFSDGQREDLLARLRHLDADGIIGYLPDDETLLNAIMRTQFPAVVSPLARPLDGLINIGQDPNVGIMGAIESPRLGPEKNKRNS